jgi:hypothetical protein
LAAVSGNDNQQGAAPMAMITHELPPLQARPSWDSRETGLRAKRRVVEIAKEAGRFALVLGIFGAVLVATMALRVAIWVPFFHH